VADRGQTDLEPIGQVLEAQPFVGRQPQTGDLLAEDAIDAVLDGRDRQRTGSDRLVGALTPTRQGAKI
jgi:hypothetical protein